MMIRRNHPVGLLLLLLLLLLYHALALLFLLLLLLFPVGEPGGLRAVIYTETLQMGVIAVGSIVLAVLSFTRVGGFPALVEKYPLTTVCGDYHNPWKMLRSADDNYMPWAGFIMGQTWSSIWYWCTDQVGR